MSSDMLNEQNLHEPRVIFESGMELYEERFEVNPHAIANTLIQRGIAAEEANAFDVVFHPHNSRLGLGKYSSNTYDLEIETITGETVSLQQRGIFVHAHPDKIMPERLLRFMLLHETGHMHRDLASENGVSYSYYDKAFLQRMRKVGTVGIGAFLASAAALPFIEMVDQEVLRDSLETIDIGIAAVGTILGLYRLTPPDVMAWAADHEEWRAHAYAVRNWRAPVVAKRKSSDLN